MAKKTNKKIKAIALFSAGLDSILAVKIIKEMEIDVTAVRFTTEYFSKKDDTDEAKDVAKKLGVKYKKIDISKEYLKILRNPKHGYGSGVNPCIDCKIFMMKQAKKLADKINAKFIFTGEVLGERPKSQNMKALLTIEKESGLKGKLLRPLSAKKLKITEAELLGWVDRDKLYGIQGRQRQPQFDIAKKFGIDYFPHPGGGCLLTQKEFSKKVKDLFEHKKTINLDDIKILKYGRHFRFGDNKIIVGKDEGDNKRLQENKGKTDYEFEVLDVGSPITILQGKKSKEAIVTAAKLTASYADCDGETAEVTYKVRGKEKKISVPVVDKKEFVRFLV